MSKKKKGKADMKAEQALFSMFDEPKHQLAGPSRGVVATMNPPFVKGSRTSKAAALAITDHRETLGDKVLAYITANPGCSDEEIAQGTGMNPSTARPRRIELERAGAVHSQGTTLTTSGRKARAWTLTP